MPVPPGIPSLFPFARVGGPAAPAWPRPALASPPSRPRAARVHLVAER